jgi:hypothetical protein
MFILDYAIIAPIALKSLTCASVSIALIVDITAALL